LPNQGTLLCPHAALDGGRVSKLAARVISRDPMTAIPLTQNTNLITITYNHNKKTSEKNNSKAQVGPSHQSLTSQKIGQRQELHVTRNFETLYTHI
jgi:hypothetical protein